MEEPKDFRDRSGALSGSSDTTHDALWFVLPPGESVSILSATSRRSNGWISRNEHDSEPRSDEPYYGIEMDRWHRRPFISHSDEAKILRFQATGRGSRSQGSLASRKKESSKSRAG